MPHTIRRLVTLTEPQTQELAGLLIDCVEGGASVSFMHPLLLSEALVFWRGVGDAATRGERGFSASTSRATASSARWRRWRE